MSNPIGEGAPNIKDGDFVVARLRWSGGAQAVQVIKISPQLVFYRDDGWKDRVRRIRISDVLFSGSKEAAEKLAAQLTSSHALSDEERRASVSRMDVRDSNYIAKAKGQTS